MIPFFYIPGHAVARPELLAQIDLDLGAGYTHMDIPTGGPDGGRGVLVFWPAVEAPHDLPNLNDHATWQWSAVKPNPARELPGGRYWLARVPGEEITPADIARRKQLEGLIAPLDDDHDWQIPAARCLPHRNRLDERGELVRTVDDEHREYFDLAADFQRSIVMAGSALQKQLHIHDAWRLAVRALASNYRLNRDLIDWLQLVTTDEALFFVACASFELPYWTLIDHEKKKRAVATPAG